MEITTWTLGPMGNNIYLLTNDAEKSIVVDPSWDDAYITEEAEKKNKPIGLIILTHGHFDHCLSAAYVKEKTGSEIWVHELDKQYLQWNVEKASHEFGISFPFTEADKTFKDGDKIEWGGEEIEIIHTPGHTPGGVCFLMGDQLITGDTLFAGSVGRWDFTGGDGKQLFKSIRKRILTLDDNITIYPGHGPKSTIGNERQNNQLLKMKPEHLGLI